MLTGTDELDAALCRAPCGCAQLERAKRETGALRSDLVRQALDAQRRWQCPRAGFPEPQPDRPPPDLDRDHVEALGCITRLTGSDEAVTCPLYYASAPWVHRVVRARQFRDTGQLDAVEPVPPAAALLDAMDAIDAALAARHDRENERMREDLARARKPSRASPHDILHDTD